MLCFATEFPLDRAVPPAEFIDAIKTWIIRVPHLSINADDLRDAAASGRWNIQKGPVRIETLRTSIEGEEYVAIRKTDVSGAVTWITDILLSRNKTDAWVGIRTVAESSGPLRQLPEVRKPGIINILLDQFGEAGDGELRVGRTAHWLDNHDVDLASRLILGQAGCHLPVAYVSCGFTGGTLVEAGALAEQLAGMAHVVVEPNRLFSRQLQARSESQNVYGGTIGVYWPDGSAKRSFFIGKNLQTPDDIGRDVVAEIQSALLNRRPQFRCTWAAAEEAFYKVELATLRESGSQQIAEYTRVFDGEVELLKMRLSDANKEIQRLGGEIRKHAGRREADAKVSLCIGDEQELAEGEILEIILDALDGAIDRVVHDSRRQHVLRALVAANSADPGLEQRRKRLKELLAGYRSMDAARRAGLKDMGFRIRDEGKHYKLVYMDDDRYTFTLPKSGSDHRGGLNSVSDISKRLF